MSLYPFAGDHAVQSAAFALEWPVEITGTELAAIEGVREALRPSLPIRNPLQTMTFHMVGGAPGVPRTAPGGVQFLRPGHSGGPARTLEVQRNKLIGQINDYTRWAPVWAEVRKWFDLVVPTLGHRLITHVGLQYTDVFHWRASPADLDLSTVFRVGSPFLPANIFELKSLWHSHHGYFIDRTEPVPHRLLENVNVNVLEELGQRSFAITTVHKADITGLNIWSWDQLKEHIDSLMSNLHIRNKANLQALLSDEAAAKISLFKGNG